MRSRAAHPEILDRRLVLREAGYGTQEEQLFQRKFALEDVALGQSPFALKVERSYHLAADDDVLQVGRELSDRVHHVIAKRLLLIVPCTLLELVRSILHEA